MTPERHTRESRSRPHNHYHHGYPEVGVLSRSYVQHAFAYAVLAVGLAYALADVESTIVYKALLVVVLATSYGSLMEFGQLFRPERPTSLADATVNLLGSTVALAWYEFERRARFVSVDEFRQQIESTESGYR
ncbi:VanZ family protein [Halopiger thermotolerans]